MVVDNLLDRSEPGVKSDAADSLRMGQANLRDMKNESVMFWGREQRPAWLLWVTVALAVAVVLTHRWMPELPLGALYILPMIPAGMVMNRWQVLLFGTVLAGVRGMFLVADSTTEAAWRYLLGLFAYWATGLLVIEIVRNRRMVVEHTQVTEEQQRQLAEAQADLKILAELSPAAIFTLDDQGQVMSGNQAAAQLLGIAVDELTGHSARESFPVLWDALQFAPGTTTFRTAAQCQGVRSDGEMFVAQTWFATYDTPKGRRLAAIAVDVSEEIRDREEQNLRQLLTHNRIVAAAMSHELRNICAAIEMVHGRLKPQFSDVAMADFEAFESLVAALGRVASLDLQARSQKSLETVDVQEIFQQLQIIITPYWKEIDGVVRFLIPTALPRVLGEFHGILQVLMNLSQNSLRAVDNRPERYLEFSVSATTHSLLLRVVDSGSGIANPAGLFEPFRSGTGRSGMGLFISRAILRSYGGDLRYESNEPGATFVVELALANGRGGGG